MIKVFDELFYKTNEWISSLNWKNYVEDAMNHLEVIKFVVEGIEIETIEEIRYYFRFEKYLKYSNIKLFAEHCNGTMPPDTFLYLSKFFDVNLPYIINAISELDATERFEEADRIKVKKMYHNKLPVLNTYVALFSEIDNLDEKVANTKNPKVFRVAAPYLTQVSMEHLLESPRVIPHLKNPTILFKEDLYALAMRCDRRVLDLVKYMDKLELQADFKYALEHSEMKSVEVIIKLSKILKHDISKYHIQLYKIALERDIRGAALLYKELLPVSRELATTFQLFEIEQKLRNDIAIPPRFIKGDLRM